MVDNKGTNVKLTEQEKKKIIELIEAGKTLPSVYKSKLFDRVFQVRFLSCKGLESELAS